MEKLEQYYKNKFENFEMDALPDAFDRIQQSLNDVSSQGSIIKEIASKKSMSALMKFSISMNVALLVALPIAYYWGVSNNAPLVQKDSVNQNRGEVFNSDNKLTQDKFEKNTSTLSNEVKNKTAYPLAKSSDKGIGNNSAEEDKRDELLDDQELNSKPSLSVPVSENKTNVTSQQTNSPDLKKEVVLNKEPKRKRNLDSFYEEHVKDLNDSTRQLFKKK